ncbi:histidine phosphatase family protein [Streptomyces sp. NPDC059740]|uniref:histidine phosphatase family protein n=1 Tax=Streptomyces sp. NPDC059740 TaxID=3346926 RepID=UPI0036581371
MTTHVLRHAETDHSRRYLVNGDPGLLLPLNEDGRRSCGQVWHTLPLRNTATWLSSEFLRARQTAAALMAVPTPDLVVDPRLNELAYGDFEGGPFLAYAAWLQRWGGWQRPPGGRESQREGIRRMLLGLLAAVDQPGPRIIVCHGLLASVLHWYQDRTGDAPMPLFFPEAPYLQPISFENAELQRCAEDLLAYLADEKEVVNAGAGGAEVFRIGAQRDVATFDRVNHPHAQRETPDA